MPDSICSATALAVLLNTALMGSAFLGSEAYAGHSARFCGKKRAIAYGSRATGYYPAKSRMEGGFKDKLGKPLNTLQDFIKGEADYVSVAMDPDVFPYGTKLTIPEINEEYGRTIQFRVVDTGRAFRDKDTDRIDICTDNRSASLDPIVNQRVTLQVCE